MSKVFETMSILLSTLVIAAAFIAMVSALWMTFADYGASIARAWRMDKLPPRGDEFRVRLARQPLVSTSGRAAPDRRSIRRAAA